MKNILPILTFILLPPLAGGLLVLLSRDRLLPQPLDGLVYPFGTDTLFYAQGTITFHFLVISLLYLSFEILMYMGYKLILATIRKIKHKE